MFVVFDELNFVWCQTKNFPAAQSVAEYLLAIGHTPRVEYNPRAPLRWYSEKKKP